MSQQHGKRHPRKRPYDDKAVSAARTTQQQQQQNRPKQSVWDRLGDKASTEQPHKTTSASVAAAVSSISSQDRRRRSTIEGSPRPESEVSLSLKGASQTARGGQSEMDDKLPRRIVSTSTARETDVARSKSKSHIPVELDSAPRQHESHSAATSRDEAVGVAAKSALPGNEAQQWIVCHSRSSGKPYYYNQTTGKSVWTEPEGFNTEHHSSPADIEKKVDAPVRIDKTDNVIGHSIRGNGHDDDKSRAMEEEMPKKAQFTEEQQYANVMSETLIPAELEKTIDNTDAASTDPVPGPEARWENRYGVRVFRADGASNNVRRRRRDPELDAIAGGIDEEECRRYKVAMVEQMLKDLENPQSSSGSQPQRIRDYAPSSIVSSVSSSWDTVEHDYDAKATAQVQEMLEHLETFLYHESTGLEGDRNLLEECEEWSSLFPHLRIRGHNLLPTGDVGYEGIPRSELRSHSPYFFIPANPPDDKWTHGIPSPVSPEHIPRVAGIGLGNDIIGRKADPDKGLGGGRSTRERGDFALDGWPGAQSMFDWSDPKTEETVVAITDANAATQARWSLFRYRKQPHDGGAGNGAVDEDRCPTPTPGNPFPRAPPLGCKPDHLVEVIASGNGELAAMKKQMGAVTKDTNEFRHFALLRQSRKRPAPAAADGKESASQAVVSFIVWDHQKDATQDSAIDGLAETPEARHVINVYDIMPLLEVRRFMEEVFAFDGEVEEWFACDTETSDEAEDHKAIKTRSRQRRALPPVTPTASIKQDIVGHLFDDIWSESRYQMVTSPSGRQQTALRIVPVTYACLVFFLIPRADSATDEDDEVGGLLGDQGKLAFDEILLRQFGEGGDGLLSAMTIRPVSLQKRESSARIRSTISKTNVRATGVRKTHLGPESRPNKSWSNPGMRLLPLPAVPGPGSMLTLPNCLNDMIYGTSIGIGPMKVAASHAWESSRPSTSIPASNSTSKRLPPIRGIVAQQDQQDVPGKRQSRKRSGSERARLGHSLQDDSRLLGSGVQDHIQLWLSMKQSEHNEARI
ncbi:hypothetical protein HDU86_007843 [Geranomyces michiganensis]|nr:hypothetical protein HDU86_007843 [Geranomyces michiganensis]